MEDNINYCHTILSAYYGILSMDEYELKAYILKEITNYLNKYIKDNKVNINIEKMKEEIKDNTLRSKLEDSLLILNDIDGPMDLKILIKRRIAHTNKKVK
jgi:hypothetical protein